MAQGKKKAQKITLDSFIAKRVARAKSLPMVVDVEFQGDLIEIHRPSNNVQLAYMSGISGAITLDNKGNLTGQDFDKMYDASRNFIFACCPFLNSDALKNEFQCAEAIDMVDKIFGIDGVVEFASSIKEAFDVEKNVKKIEDTVKN